MSRENDEHIIRRINIFFETDMPMFLHIFFDTLKSSEQNVGFFLRLCAFGEIGSFFKKLPAISPFYSLPSPLFLLRVSI